MHFEKIRLTKLKKAISLICALSIIFLMTGCGKVEKKPFRNEYTIPESTKNYTRIDTSVKEDWSAKWIWDSTDGSEENVWMTFRKTVDVEAVPQELNAHISADSKYWLYINGESVVYEGAVKRGPTPTDSYYDTVDIAPYLREGKNIISVLVWYWGKDTSYSNIDSGKGGFIFEAEGDELSVLSDSSWKVMRNSAYLKDKSFRKPNYRLPEFNIWYDAGSEMGNWTSADFDDSLWENATEASVGGEGVSGKLYPRAIPLLKDFGLKPYENSDEYAGYTAGASGKRITVDIPYNAQCTPYLKINAPAGKKIVITTENTIIGSVKTIYITKEGEQEFESPGWFNGEHITYKIPSDVTVLQLGYRETGYATEFSGDFVSENEDMNSLWQKSLRTLYVTMRDNFMDCPDRERAQWWGDVTSEMIMSMYSLDTDALLLYQKGVYAMLGHIDPETKVLQTVIPISNDYFELPVQQLAGICGFMTYYMYTGDLQFIKDVYSASKDYLALWESDESGLLKHREGSWDWLDWGKKIDVEPLENAWYYYALSSVREMSVLLGYEEDTKEFSETMSSLYDAYQTLWNGEGYKGKKGYDDRGNAIAVLSGLCPKEKYSEIKDTLFSVRNASPYMEYYVLEALCKMGEYNLAKTRMCERYSEMIDEDYSTLWEGWNQVTGTRNHAWSGGPLVIMSKHFAGIRPLEAGYEAIEIRPQYSVQNSLSCTVPTVKGYVTLDYRTENGNTLVDVTYPEGTETLLYLPQNAVVTANGKAVSAEKLSGAEYITLS